MDDDIEAVLGEAAVGIRTLSGQYRQTLFDQQIPPGLRVTIKNVLENQRSALDYLAWTITRQFGQASSRTYYPLAQTPSEFRPVMDAKMEGVAAAMPLIADAFERHQPYRQDGLRHLSKLTREHKHQRLAPHMRNERLGSAFAGTGGSIAWYGSGLPIWLVRPEVAPPEAGSVEATFVDWHFVDPDVPLLATLGDIQEVVTWAVVDIRQTAGV